MSAGDESRLAEGRTADEGASKRSLTGRDRLVRNVLSSWSTQFVLIVLGFVMPRMIDEQIGQFALGIWDFCWSIVSYLHFSNLAIGSSVNRYVARHRAQGDWDDLNGSIASVAFVQMIVASAVIIATIGIVYALPVYFADRLEPELVASQWVAALLGASMAVQMLFDPARGVITGCHRWDIHNWLNVGSQLVASVGMLLVLFAGGGLKAMAIVYFTVTVVAECLRVYIALRVCPEAVIDLSRATLRRTKEMTHFGLKTLVANAPSMLVYQTSSVIIAGVLGPAMLAVFARSFALIRHTSLFLQKFSHVLTPTASSMQGIGEEDELRELLIVSTRYAAAIVFPAFVLLAIDGDILLDIWMGEDYVNHSLIVTLALGFALPMAQTPALRVVAGMNQHGRIGVVSLVIVLSAFAIGLFLVSRVGWTLETMALLLAVPKILSDGIVVPILCCGRVGAQYTDYLRRAIVLPASLALIFGIGVWIGRFWSNNGLELAALTVAAVAGLALLYWHFLLDAEARSVVRGMVGYARAAELR